MRTTRNSSWGCLPQCMQEYTNPPRPDPGHPPGCGPGDHPPRCGPRDPPGVGLDTPPPLWTEFLTHASENITLPQLRCGR